MKKTYINPTLEVVKVNMQQQMLSGSTQNLGAKGDYSSSSITLGGRDNDGDDW